MISNGGKSSIIKLLFLVCWFVVVLIITIMLSEVFSFSDSSDTRIIKFQSLPNSRNAFINLSVFALINATLIYLGSIKKKIAQIFLIINIVVIFSTLIFVKIIAGQCSGLGCIALVYYLIPAVLAITSIPALVLLLNDKNKLPVRFITGLFTLLLIAIPLVVYVYNSYSLPKKADIAKSEALSRYVVFKPTFVPFKENSLIEGVNNKGEYDLEYISSDRGLGFNEASPRGLIADLKKIPETRIINLEGSSVAIYSTLNMGGYFRIDLAWIDKNTEIKMIYQGKGYNSINEAESDAIKIFQSMQSVEKLK